MNPQVVAEVEEHVLQHLEVKLEDQAVVQDQMIIIRQEQETLLQQVLLKAIQVELHLQTLMLVMEPVVAELQHKEQIHLVE
tara:strand:- start:128 stop:370 length:243 start_codon:yes stop_codon:yes gene_type:complete